MIYVLHICWWFLFVTRYLWLQCLLSKEGSSSLVLFLCPVDICLGVERIDTSLTLVPYQGSKLLLFSTSTNNSTKCTSHTMEPKLHNGQEFSQRSQIHNAYKDVDVGRVTSNKSEYWNPNHFNILCFRNNRFTYSFIFRQLITWTLALIASSLCFLIWIGWRWNPKLSLCTLYSILFMIVCEVILPKIYALYCSNNLLNFSFVIIEPLSKMLSHYVIASNNTH